MWILYEGKPDLTPMQVMSKKQILVGNNTNLPIVYSLKNNVTTEISILLLGEY